MESVSCSTGARSSVNIMSLGLVGARLLIVLSSINDRSSCEFGPNNNRLCCRFVSDVVTLVATSIELNVSGTSMTCTEGNTDNNVAERASTRRRSVLVRPTLIASTPLGVSSDLVSRKNSLVVRCHGMYGSL